MVMIFSGETTWFLMWRWRISSETAIILSCEMVDKATQGASDGVFSIGHAMLCGQDDRNARQFTHQPPPHTSIIQMRVHDLWFQLLDEMIQSVYSYRPVPQPHIKRNNLYSFSPQGIGLDSFTPEATNMNCVAIAAERWGQGNHLVFCTSQREAVNDMQHID